MELFLCVFSHIRVSNAVMQLSQLRRTGFTVGIIRGSYDIRFLLVAPKAAARALQSLYYFLIHSVINTSDQF